MPADPAAGLTGQTEIWTAQHLHRATPFLSLVIVAVDVLIIYGLVAYARRSAV